MATRELHVGAGLGVSLELLVVVDVGDDVPLGQVNHGALVTNKGLLPDHVHAGHIGGESGSGREGQREKGERLKEHHVGRIYKECVFFRLHSKNVKDGLFSVEKDGRISDEILR